MATGLPLHNAMKQRGLTIPDIMLIGGTRVALGAGVGLLISDRLNKDQRRGAGWALLGVGILTTIPIVIGILTKPRVAEAPLVLAS
jgi:hypothetical protein